MPLFPHEEVHCPDNTSPSIRIYCNEQIELEIFKKIESVPLHHKEVKCTDDPSHSLRIS
jgi:hypothetical protein